MVNNCVTALFASGDNSYLVEGKQLIQEFRRLCVSLDLNFCFFLDMLFFNHFSPLKLQTRCHVLATPPPAGLQQINSNKEAHNPRDSPPRATGASTLRRPSSSCPFSSGFSWLWFFTLWKACFLSRPLFSINTRNRSEASHNRYSSFPGTAFKIKLWV